MDDEMRDYKIPVMFLPEFFQLLILEVARPIVTKFCHMFDADPDVQM